MRNKRMLMAMAGCAGLAVSAVSSAQVSIVNNISGSFTDVSGTGTLVVTGDDQSGPVTVSAAASNTAFPAGTLNACTNGHAGYGGAATTFGNTTLPAALVYTGAVAFVYWDDMITQAGGAGVYQQEVTENGHQVQVVEWVRMDHYFSSPSNVTFELKIYGGASGPSNSFAQYLYQSMVFGEGDDNGASATVGYQYNTTSAEQYSYNTAGSIPDNSTLTLVPGTTGACCLGNGTCSLLSANNCSAQGGTYRGDNTTCATANCPIGACCLNDGTCVMTASAGCAAQSGVYRGDGTTCATANCPSGACCTADGCIVTGPGLCATLGGTYHGDGSTCAQAGCPVNLVCNGGFESGSFGPCWTQFGDTSFTAVNTGAWVNITPHGGTHEAHFGPTGGTGGIQQAVNGVTAGTMVTIDFWYAALGSNNSFSADLGSTHLIDFTNDTAHTNWTEFTFTVPAPTDNPVLSFTMANPPSYDYLDDIRVTGPATQGCYANCDHSTTVPFLNVNDFVCFQTKFAAGDSYANCDQSTTPPVLNVNDFVCFQTKFAAGCSAP